MGRTVQPLHDKADSRAAVYPLARAVRPGAPRPHSLPDRARRHETCRGVMCKGGASSPRRRRHRGRTARLRTTPPSSSAVAEQGRVDRRNMWASSGVSSRLVTPSPTATLRSRLRGCRERRAEAPPSRHGAEPTRPCADRDSTGAPVSHLSKARFGTCTAHLRLLLGGSTPTAGRAAPMRCKDANVAAYGGHAPSRPAGTPTLRSSARAAPLVGALYIFQFLSAPRGPPGTSNDAGGPPLRGVPHDKEQHAGVVKRLHPGGRPALGSPADRSSEILL